MLPLMFTLALDTAPAAAPPDGTYTYASTYRGESVAKSTIVVKRDATGNVVLTENAGGSMSGQTASVQDTLTLDASLSPSTYTAALTVPGRTTHDSVLFDGMTAKLSGDSGAQSFTLGTDVKHFVVLDFGPFSGYFALPAQMLAWGDAPVLALFPSYAQSAPMSLDATLKPERPKNLPATESQITMSKPAEFTVWYDPKTLVVDEVDVPSQSIEIVRQP